MSIAVGARRRSGWHHWCAHANSFNGGDRIRQAIGRMVRAPGQHATILFHCCRFTESHYQSLFTENNPTHIRTNEGLTAWLASLRSNLSVAEEEVSQTEEDRSVEK